MNPIRILASLSLISFFASAACVTVNVNFPESAVQKATDDYVREIYRAKEKGKGSTSPAVAEPAKTTSSFSLISTAWAGPTEGNFQVRSVKAQAIQTRMAGRIDEIVAQKRAGIFGETNDGMLVVHMPQKLAKLLLQKAEKTIGEENTDRKELYAEIVKINGLESSRMSAIQKSFSRSFQAESPSGTWVQDTGGNWSQKP